jgi:hypothetical protein
MKSYVNPNTSSDGSGGKGGNPKIMIILLAFILIGIGYIIILLSKKPEAQSYQYYKILPYHENSDTTSSDGSAGKDKGIKFRKDTFIVYRNMADSSLFNNCPCCPKTFMMYSLTTDSSGSGNKGGVH